MEIVGVVNDLAMTNGGDPRPFPGAGFYQPMEPGLRSPVYMVVRAPGDPEALVPQIHAATSSIDPRLRVGGVFQPADIGRNCMMHSAIRITRQDGNHRLQ